MVGAPPALDVAVGGATVAVAVAVVVAVAVERVVVLPQAASASTSARLNANKSVRIGDPSPYEWSGGLCRCKPQPGSAIREVLLQDYGTRLQRTGVPKSGVCGADLARATWSALAYVDAYANLGERV